MISPAVILLLMWMIIPLGMTIYFSTLRYNLLQPGNSPFVGWENYYWFFTDPSFSAAMINSLVLVGGVLLITIVGGILFAMLLNQAMWGQGIIRILVISPFFVMPTVSGLVWKNMFMNPVNGIFGHIAKLLGFAPIDFFGQNADGFDHPNRVLAVAAICDTDPFDGLPILGSGTVEAAEMDGATWCIALLVYHVAAFGPRNHHRDLDRDHLPSVDLRGNPCDHQWWPGVATTEPDLLDLSSRRLYNSMWASAAPVVSSQSSLPISSHLPDADDRQEPGRLRRDDMARAVSTNRKLSIRPPPGHSVF